MEVSTFPIVIIFFRGCVPEMFITSHFTYCIYIPGKNGILLSLLRSLWRVHISDTFWFADGIRLFVHYIISLSSLCELIWRHWTYKMPGIYILSTVWIRLSIFSQLSIIRYMGLYVLSLPIFRLMIERNYILCLIIIIKSEVWTIIHCLVLGLETTVCAVCLAIFFWECQFGDVFWKFHFWNYYHI